MTNVSLNVIATLSVERLTKFPDIVYSVWSVFSVKLPTNVFVLPLTVIVSNTSVGCCPFGMLFCPCHVPLPNLAGIGGVGDEDGVGVGVGVSVGAGVGTGVGVSVGAGVGSSVGVATTVWAEFDLVISDKIVIPVLIMKIASNAIVIIRRLRFFVRGYFRGRRGRSFC